MRGRRSKGKGRKFGRREGRETEKQRRIGEERLSLLALIHRLTVNGKVVSLPKKINFEVSKFDKYPSFSKRSSYSLRQPSSPLETCSSGLVWSMRPPWIVPPRAKSLAGLLTSLCPNNMNDSEEQVG